MKKIKMVVYGEPGTGKSVFASGSPKPFFICTDGNYEWLEDWGAKEEDHLQVYSWEEATKAFQMDFSDYDTIVVDLTEDLFKWCEFEWCKKNGINHVGDLNYGKGYDITRNEFFIEICKLLNLDKNIILIMHGMTEIVKDRRGVEYTKYRPTNRLPDKLINMIEGRVRYFVRAFATTEEGEDGKLVTKRYLSLSPDGTTEFGITRGLSADSPRYIDLDWNTFHAVATKNASTVKIERKPAKVEQEVKEVKNEVPEQEVEAPKSRRGRKPKEETPAASNEISELEAIVSKVRASLKDMDEEPTPEEEPVEEPVEQPAVVEKKEVVEEQPKASEPVSQADKLAAIKAKLAALKNK